MSDSGTRGAPPLPHRPRLADHAMLRRHLRNGEERLVVHDPEREQVLEIDVQQLGLIRCLDGTRDLGGIMLAAVRAGVFKRTSELQALLQGLHQRGLLADGIEGLEVANALQSPPEVGSTKPLRSLADFGLHCEVGGSCCSTYSSIPFSKDEAARALALVPEVGDGVGERVFLPLHGSVEQHACAVTLVDGRCAFLNDDTRCEVHVRGGALAKPRGCRIFPASFVDDGEVVRVSVGVECACVLDSLGRAGGEPLAPADASCEGELIAGSRIVRLPESLQVAAERRGTRAELRAWSDALVAVLPLVIDGVAACWSLAAAVQDHGLDVAAAERALSEAEPPVAAALAFRLMALAGQTRDKCESSAGWRAEADRTRRVSAWLDDAAQALMDQAVVEARLQHGVEHGTQEAFYLRACLFGLGLVAGELTLVQALRDRATRLLLARQAATCVTPECVEDRSAKQPITAVEAMMRGQGLAAYARGLP